MNSNLVKRDQYSNNGAVSNGSFERIRKFEQGASDLFFDFLLRQSAVQFDGAAYDLIYATDVPPQLAGKFSTSQPLIRMATYSEQERKDLITILDPKTKTGAQVQLYEDPDCEDEIYDIEEHFYTAIGLRWTGALLDPEKEVPELSELVEEAQSSIYDPEYFENLALDTGKASEATAELNLFTLGQFLSLLAIYKEVAYPSGTVRNMAGDDERHLFGQLKSGDNLDLRSNTENLGCAKLLFHVVSQDFYSDPDKVRTWMYLNYDIPIGLLKFHFKEDLEMAAEYRSRAAAFMVAEGIATQTTIDSILNLENKD